MIPLNDDTAATRAAMVDELCAMGGIGSPEVAEAFRWVPRHLFAPGVPLGIAYAPNTSVWPKHDARGAVTSTVSAAHIQAVMLEQAALRPGMRVLEIGSGGYNAALVARLVGPDGEVTSVDIDAEIVERARGCLDAAGYRHVRTLLADGDAGIARHAPYDRILVTARAWDIPAAWVEQLTFNGRIVVPLRLRCLTRSVALDRLVGSGIRMAGTDIRLCSFVPMQGAGAHDEQVVAIDGGRIQLRTDTTYRDDDFAALAYAIATAVHQPRVELWSGVEFDHVDDLDLWLGTWLPSFGILAADHSVVEEGLLTAATRHGAPALVTPGGFAYRTKRPIPDTDRYETGVLAWGPDATALGARYVELVQRWDRYRRDGGSGPRIDIYPASPADALNDHQFEGRVIHKTHTRIVLTWPHAQPHQVTTSPRRGRHDGSPAADNHVPMINPKEEI